ncbi:hypothetical protein BJX66DRAFT_178347 [Aspergillus keveii]|uniref:Uncharacterized protein n=1 Tax=Aspergillus keveii TaxID=714993 RepID=A0ABR4G7G3_9EURO
MICFSLYPSHLPHCHFSATTMALSPEATIALAALFVACVPGLWFSISRIRRRRNMDLARDSELPLLPVAEHNHSDSSESNQDDETSPSGSENVIDFPFVPTPSVDQTNRYTSRCPLPIRVEGGLAYYGYIESWRATDYIYSTPQGGRFV